MLLPPPPGQYARLRKSQLSLFLPDGTEPAPKPPPESGPPGSGWFPIPGSKAGGFHRRKGKRYEYWYPGDAAPRDTPHVRDGHAAHPPGAGWEAIPSSPVGGWHRPKDGASFGQKEYWYPGDSAPRSAPVQQSRTRVAQQQGLLPTEDATLSRVRTKAHELGYPWASIEPLAAFVVQHGTARDADRLLEALRAYQRDPRFGIALAPATTSDSRALTVHTWHHGGPDRLREELRLHLKTSRQEGQGVIFVISRSSAPEVELNPRPVDWATNRQAALQREQRHNERSAARRAAERALLQIPTEADYWHQDGEEVRVIRDADYQREVYGDKPPSRRGRPSDRLLVQARRPGERIWYHVLAGTLADPATAQRAAEDYRTGRIPRHGYDGRDEQGTRKFYPFPRTLPLEGKHVPVSRLADWYEPPWYGKSPDEEAILRDIYADGSDFDIWPPPGRLPLPPPQ